MISPLPSQKCKKTPVSFGIEPATFPTVHWTLARSKLPSVPSPLPMAKPERWINSLVCVRPSGSVGLGVFATVAIPPGTLLFQMDDSRVVTPEAPLRPAMGEDGKYCDYLGPNLIVHNGIPERFVNHSCDPNAYVATRNGSRWEVTIRRIAAGEELTNDYSINGIEDDPQEVIHIWTCQCGSSRCREKIVHSFFKLPRQQQLEYLPLLDSWFRVLYREQIARLLPAH